MNPIALLPVSCHLPVPRIRGRSIKGDYSDLEENWSSLFLNSKLNDVREP
jgi:hypothetical protein